MGIVRWNISANDIDDFDRSKQFKPYAGPVPPNNTVFLWRIKKMQYVPATRDKLEQLRVGLELVPRKGFDESRYAGYFIMNFIPVAPNTGFRYVPLCDALGISGRDFTERMRADKEGNILRIGKWQNDGQQLILAKFTDWMDNKGNPRKEVDWMGPIEDDYEDDYEDDDNLDDDEYADDDDEWTD